MGLGLYAAKIPVGGMGGNIVAENREASPSSALSPLKGLGWKALKQLSDGI